MSMVVFWVVTTCGLVSGYFQRNILPPPTTPHGITAQKSTINIFRQDSPFFKEEESFSTYFENGKILSHADLHAISWAALLIISA
jgi:hypothetical protein